MATTQEAAVEVKWVGTAIFDPQRGCVTYRCAKISKENGAGELTINVRDTVQYRDSCSPTSVSLGEVAALVPSGERKEKCALVRPWVRLVDGFPNHPAFRVLYSGPPESTPSLVPLTDIVSIASMYLIPGSGPATPYDVLSPHHLGELLCKDPAVCALDRGLGPALQGAAAPSVVVKGAIDARLRQLLTPLAEFLARTTNTPPMDVSRLFSTCAAFAERWGTQSATKVALRGGNVGAKRARGDAFSSLECADKSGAHHVEAGVTSPRSTPRDERASATPRVGNAPQQESFATAIPPADVSPDGATAAGLMLTSASAAELGQLRAAVAALTDKVASLDTAQRALQEELSDQRHLVNELRAASAAAAVPRPSREVPSSEVGAHARQAIAIHPPVEQSKLRRIFSHKSLKRACAAMSVGLEWLRCTPEELATISTSLAV